jgi:uncharacterized repeat protein (TIGR03803 family)
VLWSFGGDTDGQDPEGALVAASDGNFYGTTKVGGPLGYGTVFRITPAGIETVLHTFSYTDGSEPAGTLTNASDGLLYGTASAGGSSGGGIFFKIDTAGTFSIVWNFGAGNDAAGPDTGVIQARDGTFYGTSTLGGSIRICDNGISGCGTIFKVTPDGTETVLYDFGFGGNGSWLYPEELVEAPDVTL